MLAIPLAIGPDPLPETAETILSMLSLALNASGVAFAVAAAWVEIKDRRAETRITRTIQRTRRGVAKFLGRPPRTISITVDDAVVAHDSASVTITADGEVSTGDPVEDRFRRLEEALAETKARITAETATLHQKVQQVRTDSREQDLAILRELSTMKVEEQRIVSRVMDWELLGLVLVGAGTLLQAVVQAFGGS